MSKHKAIPKKKRLELYEKYNHRCAYCGCELEYKDMQVDHIKSVYVNTDLTTNMTEKEMYSDRNLLPACRQCNLYKSTMTLDQFRERLQTTLIENITKSFQWRLAEKYGLVQYTPREIKFYYEMEDTKL